MRHAPPVNAELPPRQCSGEISSCNTEAPPSRADNAAQVAAFPAPTTITSTSGMSIAPSDLTPLPYPSRLPGESRDPTSAGARAAHQMGPRLPPGSGAEAAAGTAQQNPPPAPAGPWWVTLRQPPYVLHTDRCCAIRIAPFTSPHPLMAAHWSAQCPTKPCSSPNMPPGCATRICRPRSSPARGIASSTRWRRASAARDKPWSRIVIDYAERTGPGGRSHILGRGTRGAGAGGGARQRRLGACLRIGRADPARRRRASRRAPYCRRRSPWRSRRAARAAT